jgi:hypothetical protein
MVEPIPLKPSDIVERKELAIEAKELLENKAFTAAILALRKRWFAEQMATRDKDEIFAIALKIQALEEMPQALQLLINDQRMAEARKK